MCCIHIVKNEIALKGIFRIKYRLLSYSSSFSSLVLIHHLQLFYRYLVDIFSNFHMLQVWPIKTKRNKNKKLILTTTFLSRDDDYSHEADKGTCTNMQNFQGHKAFRCWLGENPVWSDSNDCIHTMRFYPRSQHSLCTRRGTQKFNK